MPLWLAERWGPGEGRREKLLLPKITVEQNEEVGG